MEEIFKERNTILWHYIFPSLNNIYFLFLFLSCKKIFVMNDEILACRVIVKYWFTSME